MDSKHKYNTPDFCWRFSESNDGSFIVDQAKYLPPVYFPLMNSYGMKSYVTPDLKGDLCSSFHTWLTPATVTEELHRNVSSRNFWIKESDKEPWSVTGVSVFQKEEDRRGRPDTYSVEGHLGYFTCKRFRKESNLEAAITVFVPETNHYIELIKLTIKNVGAEKRNFKASYALPIFGRSADNFRDHRQVTTMFQETFIETFGVRVKPRIVHDETGHRENRTQYVVLGTDRNGEAPKDIWALVEDYIGIGGSFDNPASIYYDLLPVTRKEKELHGKEAIGAFRFEEITLNPGESFDYIVIEGITEKREDIKYWINEFGSTSKFDLYLKETIDYWKKRSDFLSFYTGNVHYDNWVKWIAYQVKARQIFGNSYLPDYGYGRGGRGWRDLWQDLLSIFLVDPESARTEILNNFKGIRIDGSNATIIGTSPGEFKADRNDIPRTWSDHGAWPVFILNFYIHQTGDFDILFNKITFWKDQFTHRSKSRDEQWNESAGNLQLDQHGNIYEGSLFEHILLQQLSAFFNVGEHNILLLEGADWNDTYDMARDRGESVCFHNFYAHNFIILAELLRQLKKRGYTNIFLLKEALALLDTLPGQILVDYQSVDDKHKRLNAWFESVKHIVSGEKVSVLTDDLINDLEIKGKHMTKQITDHEIITIDNGHQFFNGHYNNVGERVGCNCNGNIQMDLTSQVMPILCNISNDHLTKNIYNTICKVLKDKDEPGIRLCTEFKEFDMNFGRVTGFVYGNKEHGSKWMQQNIMLAYGLYGQGFVDEGFEVLNEVYKMSTDTAKAKIFPGIPSFFNNENKGAYAYLTGSSSWYLLTLTTMIFGVRGENGGLCIQPKLKKEQFDSRGIAKLRCNFQNLTLSIEFENLSRLDYRQYGIKTLKIDDVEISFGEIEVFQGKIVIPQQILSNLDKCIEHHILVGLNK
jgi:cellobiose phosphorylase